MQPVPSARIPFPSATFIGRAQEIARLEEGLSRVPVALIYGGAGIGKSALAYAFAALTKGPVVYHKVASDEPLAAVLDDVRRQLPPEPAPELADDFSRLKDLSRRLESSAALWVLDDINYLAPEAQEALLVALGSSLRQGRLVATSRELLRRFGNAPDWVELRLGGLDYENARVLWFSLDELYGPSAGFETAWQRSRGSPLILRRAHAGEVDEEDPLAAEARALTPDERVVAGALALAGMRLPTEVLLGLPPGSRLRAAVRQLSTRMLLEVDGAGTVAISDLYRDAVLDELSPDERRGLHGELARLLPQAELDPVVRVREVCRHLAALDRVEEAGAYLLQHGVELIRRGAAGELLRAYELVPRERRTPELELARWRTLVRVGELARVQDELTRLDGAKQQETDELRLLRGQLEMLVGELPQALATLEPLVKRAELPAKVKARAQLAYARVLTYLGRGDDARQHLSELERDGDAHLSLTGALGRAESLWVDERDEEADEALHRAREFSAGRGSSLQARILVPALTAAIRARQGRLADAEESLKLAEKELPRPEDLLLRSTLRFLRATLLFERGDRTGALEEFRNLALVAEQTRSPMLTLWAQIYAARVMLVVGQREQAYRLLEEMTKKASARGITSAVKMVERSAVLDPLSQLQSGGPSTGRKGTAVRTRALEALKAAAAGEGGRAAALLDANVGSDNGPGYGLDRAIGHLARATLARLQGREVEADEALARANREAAAEAVDADLLSALSAAVGRLRAVTGAERRFLPDVPADLERYEVVLDGRTHELRNRLGSISLKSRPVLRRLLYALAGRPNGAFTKEELARAIWSGAYNAMVHDNALRVNIKNLRALLEGSGLSVDLQENGYSLAVPKDFLFIDSLEREGGS